MPNILYRPLNMKLTWCGIDRRMMIGCVFVGFAVYFSLGRDLRAILFGLGTAFGLYKAFFEMTKKDPMYPFLLWRWWFSKKCYDPIKRNEHS